jgi:hypothetical protein
MRKFAFLSVALGLSTPAMAGSVASIPKLDVTPSCRAASAINVADRQSFATCMRDELDARKQVSASWASYSASARSRCAIEATIGGDPSYVELQVCLNMDRDLVSSSGEGTAKR